MSIESKRFFKINKIIKIFIISVLACCILMNIKENYQSIRFISILETFDTLFNLSIVFLISFILCLYYENKYTTIILIIINVLFCYFTINERKDLSWYDNPINHYDIVLRSFADLFDPHFRKFIFRTTSSLSFLINLLIWIIIIPFRIYKFYLNKNVTT